MTDTNELLALLLRETVHQFRDARAQLHADDQRAWEALGRPEGTHDTTHVQRLCAEVERLRAELRRMSEWHDEIADTVPCDVAGPHYGIVEWHLKVLAERDAARAEVERLRGEVDQIKADQCSLLRIIGDSFLHLHIPHSAMAFDGRNLTPHAEESARASEIYRTERDAARAEVERLRSRVGWLDHLDTPEGRAMHGSEAVRVENEQVRAQRDSLAATLIEVQRELLAARNKIRADEEHLPTIGRLTQDLYETEQELDAARAEVASLREGQRELARAVKFLDMCNKQRIASGETGAMSDAWQWVEEAAREMIDAAKETP